MSANNVLCLSQHNAVIVVSDTASYTIDGIVREWVSKIRVADHWPGILTGRGQTVAMDIIAPALIEAFDTFDGLVDGIENALAEIVEASGLPLKYELILAGLSTRRDRPESYMIQTADMPNPEDTPTSLEVARKAGLLPKPFELVRVPDCVNGPHLGIEATIDAGFDGFPDNGDIAQSSKILRLMIEAQRHQPDRNGFYWVGGCAEQAIVTTSGVSTAIIAEWLEDRLGELVRPAPIDWSTFRKSIGLSPGRTLAERNDIKRQIADLDRQLAAVEQSPPIPSGLSRLQRERMGKKARKGTLRVV